ncbi:MAG: DNA recombination protein RmuC [Acidimicrobiales bacterium]
MDIAVLLALALALVVGLAAGLAVTLVLARRGGLAGAEMVDTVVAVADQRLGATRGLIDGQLRALHDELGRVTDTVAHLENERARQHGELTAQLHATVDQTASLTTTTAALREVLASPKARGQWGERMAEDVLRLAGLVEGVSYVKQKAVLGGTIPDFTFLLPRGMRLHMDAKFPAANYARCLEAETDHDRSLHCRSFLKDVRARVRELNSRGYVDPPNGTLDYVLLFIPNESIYSFVHEHDPGLLDVALSQKVVLCSPLSLFAVLAVVRRAVDAAVVEETSGEILSVLGAFTSQWEGFCQSLDKVGRAVDGVERAYGELAGTRRRALERPLARVEELRRQRSLAEAEPAGATGDDGTDGLRLVEARERREASQG